MTIMASISSLAGTVRIDLAAPRPRGASRASRASGARRSTRRRRRRRCSPHGIFAGSFSAVIATRRPATVMLSASVVTSFGKTRMTVSYFSRYARCVVVEEVVDRRRPRCPSRSERMRKTLRPMRPKPLMPTRIARVTPLSSAREALDEVDGAVGVAVAGVEPGERLRDVLAERHRGERVERGRERASGRRRRRRSASSS